jgi:hypothetical protein
VIALPENNSPFSIGFVPLFLSSGRGSTRWNGCQNRGCRLRLLVPASRWRLTYSLQRRGGQKCLTPYGGALPAGA